MANALVELHGIPIDVETLGKIMRNRERIRRDLVAESPVGREIYNEKKASFDHKRFGAWLEKNEITGWQIKGKNDHLYSRKEEDLELYAGVHPLLKQYRDLYFSLKDFASSVSAQVGMGASTTVTFRSARSAEETSRAAASFSISLNGGAG
jgi:hypothetical protein